MARLRGKRAKPFTHREDNTTYSLHPAVAGIVLVEWVNDGGILNTSGAFVLREERGTVLKLTGDEPRFADQEVLDKLWKMAKPY